MFKKICLFISCVLVLSSIYHINKTPIFKDYATKYEVYLNSPDSTANFIMVDQPNFCFLSGVKGESFKTEKNTFDLESFLKDFSANLVFLEEIEQGVSYYAFSNKIKYRTTLHNKTVNLHVFINDTMVTIGSPLISGSF